MESELYDHHSDVGMSLSPIFFSASSFLIASNFINLAWNFSPSFSLALSYFHVEYLSVYCYLIPNINRLFSPSILTDLRPQSSSYIHSTGLRNSGLFPSRVIVVVLWLCNVAIANKTCCGLNRGFSPFIAVFLFIPFPSFSLSSLFDNSNLKYIEVKKKLPSKTVIQRTEIKENRGKVDTSASNWGTKLSLFHE